MNIKRGFIKVAFCTGFISLANSCGTIMDVLFVNAGVSKSNQSLKESYSPDGDSIVPLRALPESSGQGESINSSSLPLGGESQEAILGYFAGVGANVPLNSNLLARTELRFSSKGSKTEINNIASNTTRLGYIDVPIELQYRVRPKWTIQGGLQPSFLLAANIKSEVNGESSDRSIKDTYNALDLAATFGVGYDINRNLGIRLGYDLGLLNVEKQSDFREVKNRFLRVGLQYTLKRW